MKQNSLKKNAFYSVLKVFLSLIFPLITFPYASRILLPEGIGKVNFANSIVSYFILIASLGIGGYATREAVKVRDDKIALTKLFKEIITINFICCLIAYFLFFVAIFTVPKFYEYQKLLLVCCVKILFSVIGIDWIYTAHEEFKYITLRSFIVQLLSLIYLFVFVKTKEDIIHYAIFGILTSVGSNILNLIMVGKFLDFHDKSKLELFKHFKSIIIFFGMTVVTSIYTMLDTTMLGFLSGDIEVGYYTAGTKLSHMVLSMLTAITAVLLPRLTNYASNNDSSSYNDLITKSSNIIILLSIPMIAGLMILSKPLIILLSGENYIPAIPSMLILSPLLLIMSFGSLIGGQILPSLGKEKIAFYSYIAGAATNVTLNFLFIPKLGAKGASIGTLGAESVVTLIQLINSRKYLFNKITLFTLLQVLFSTVIMGSTLVIILHFINNILLQLSLSFIFGIITYSILLFLLRNYYFRFYLHKIFKYFNQTYILQRNKKL